MSRCGSNCIQLLGLAALALSLGACGRSALGIDDIGLDGAADSASGEQGPDGGAGDDSNGDGPSSDVSSSDVPIFSPDGPGGPDAEPGSCGPASCDGCCNGATCVPLTQSSASQCGFAGVACIACKTGGSCFKGACVYPTPHCGPANCPGCCIDANDCSDGTAQDACGSGGQECQGCGPEGNLVTCAPQAGGGGSCHTTCDPGSCHGCCNGAACELGQSASACGANGAPCAACPQGEFCAVQGNGGGGMCQEPCSPSTCAGCCQGEVCAVGNQDIACGTGGGACADCTSRSYLCVKGTCQP